MPTPLHRSRMERSGNAARTGIGTLRCGRLLHDVLEDTKLPRAELAAQFPAQDRLLALVRISQDREAVIVKCAACDVTY
jgi:hypothetical protein